MAVLNHIQNGDLVLLKSQHVFGRDKSVSHTFFAENDVSRSHATIFWKDGHWHLRDHSRNGTQVKDKYVHRNTVKLSRGDTMQFGRNKMSRWELIDDAAPASYLQSVIDEDKILALTSCQGFPNPEDQKMSFFYGQDHRWKLETDGELIDLSHGTILRYGDDDWKFVENEVLDETVNHASLAENAFFQFNLSADEERISIKIVLNELELDLGERVYHYLLLALARQRLDHDEMDYVFADQGWMSIDDLTHDMSKEFRKEIDAYYLNLQIYRLRKQLLEMEPLGYMFSDIIERRKGEIRFAYQNFKIIKEDVCIGQTRKVA